MKHACDCLGRQHSPVIWNGMEHPDCNHLQLLFELQGDCEKCDTNRKQRPFSFFEVLLSLWRRMFSIFRWRWTLFYYCLASSWRAWRQDADKSASSIKTTSDCGDLLESKAKTRRFLVISPRDSQHPLTYYSEWGNTHFSLTVHMTSHKKLL